MVEHALQGEDGSVSILDFITRGKWMRLAYAREIPSNFRTVCCADPQLEGVDRDTIAAQLREVGFDDDRQTHTVGSLSGGWKMKLELARAMLYKADLLMLDEPTNHVSPRLGFQFYVASGKRVFKSWSEDLVLQQRHTIRDGLMIVLLCRDRNLTILV